MSNEHTTRFLFPAQPQQLVHTVFETKCQQGMPGFKEKTQNACLPPLKAGARGHLVVPGSKADSSLACYKHYDVQLDWSEVRHSVILDPSWPLLALPGLVRIYSLL